MDNISHETTSDLSKSTKTEGTDASQALLAELRNELSYNSEPGSLFPVAGKRELPSDFQKWNLVIDASPNFPQSDRAGNLSVENGNKTGKASEAFRAQTEKILNALPADIRQVLQEKNVKVVVAQRFDIPSPPGALGVYDENTNTITISEKAQRGDPQEVLKATIYHEVGHAVDGKELSQSKNLEFQQALEADRNSLGRNNQKKLASFMQRDNHSSAESYAEAFAFRQIERLGGKVPEVFLKPFANTMAYLRKKYP